MIRRPATRAAWAAELIKAATIHKPDGEGPFPVSIQFHGCGGLRPFMTAYTEDLLAAGVAVINVDSFKPRGISRVAATLLVCSGAKLRGAERAADVFALYDWAQRQDWIDPKRICLAGWSHGSWSIMDALAMGERAQRYTGLTDVPAEPFKTLAAAFLVYPYARYPALTTPHGWNGATPHVAAVVCGKDQVVGERHAHTAFDRLERDGVHVQRLHHGDATHAFEDERASDPRVRFRADLFEETRRWYVEQLESAFLRIGG